MQIGSPCGIVDNLQDCDFVLTEFEILSRYYVIGLVLRGKIWNPLSPLAKG